MWQIGRTRLIVLIGWKGVGTAELEAAPDAWPRLDPLVAGGAGTVTGTTGSLPLDPAATLTTIGTGAIPAEHGIIGSLIRDDRGRVVRAWSDAAPPSIVSTFAEDLDDGTGQTARIGLVAPRATDRGLVGGDWYLDADRDDRRMGPGDPVRAVSRLIATGYGRDPTVDVLGVVLEGSAEDGPNERGDRPAHPGGRAGDLRGRRHGQRGEHPTSLPRRSRPTSRQASAPRSWRTRPQAGSSWFARRSSRAASRPTTSPEP